MCRCLRRPILQTISVHGYTEQSFHQPCQIDTVSCCISHSLCDTIANNSGCGIKMVVPFVFIVRDKGYICLALSETWYSLGNYIKVPKWKPHSHPTYGKWIWWMTFAVNIFCSTQILHLLKIFAYKSQLISLKQGCHPCNWLSTVYHSITTLDTDNMRIYQYWMEWTYDTVGHKACTGLPVSNRASILYLSFSVHFQLKLHGEEYNLAAQTWWESSIVQD